MALATIRERLRQIDEFLLPHEVVGGNALKTSESKGLVSCKVLGHLEGRIPEVLVPLTKSPFDPDMELLSSGYSASLAKAAGDGSKMDDYLVTNQTATRVQIDPNKVTVHAFYDPLTDMTHYFLMPEVFHKKII